MTMCAHSQFPSNDIKVGDKVKFLNSPNPEHRNRVYTVTYVREGRITNKIVCEGLDRELNANLFVKVES